MPMLKFQSEIIDILICARNFGSSFRVSLYLHNKETNSKTIGRD